ncbi:MAG: hypothetical protein KDC98_17610 [Planctomycetes bacterium]|nr:hypothetical protein [Planctomycetota bacterium]
MLRLLLPFFVAASLGAQDAFAAEEQALAKKATSTLLSFANQANSRKVGQRAKQALDLILEYDSEHKVARRQLDFEMKSGTWVLKPEEKRTKWRDKATYENRFKTMDEWFKTCMKLSGFHKDLGLKMQKAGDGRATFHLEKAVYYNAMDEEANLALGLKKGPNFYGTDEQLAFAARMKEIEIKAVELARKDYPVEALPFEKMPKELAEMQQAVPDFMRKPNIDIFGAKSAHFTIWSRGTQDNADDAVRWAERGLDFGLYLIGEDQAKKLRFVERATKSFDWYAFLFTGREREEFLKANPHIWQGQGTLEDAKRFANTMYRSAQGAGIVLIGPSPRRVHDYMVSYVMQNGLLQGRNDGLGQGVVHAVCWYMKATSISKWGALPEGTQGEDALQLPEGTNWWLRTIRDQASSHQDWPVAQVPRERLSRFRNDCRMKTWSFMTWAMAAYPDKWLDLLVKMPTAEKRPPTLEEVDAVFQAVLKKSADQVDAEWREWARGDSGVAFGTGYGPPLLPERPSKIEIAALERLNQVRSQMIAYTWEVGADGKPKMREGTLSGLPPCEMDAEASLGCEKHSLYVTNHPELAEMPGPEIHEENPAHEDFTRAGQLAGSGNIVTGQGQRGEDFAENTVDLWVGVPYHRFPMLEHNIKRLGYSYVYENDWSVAVLDMNSLEEPYDPQTAPRFLVWPPVDSTGIPTNFPAPESPNPLADQPEDQQDVTKCGYPISLQLQRELAANLAEAEIEVFESRKGGRPPTQHFVSKTADQEVWKQWTDRCKAEPVEIWVHTPSLPLNKKRDRRDVVFAIPKEPLKKGKTYQARVLLRLGGNDPLVFIWEFTTGSAARTLKL